MRTALFLLALAGLLGCGTQPQLSEIVNDMLVLTNYQPNINFSNLATYALTMDEVGLNSNTTSQTALKNDYAKMITAQIKKNLDQTGHTQVDSLSNPDIGVTVLIVDNLSVSQSVIYPGGYYYPSYYGYYGYYGGYGGGYVTTNYFQSAMLVIELVDLKDKGAGSPPSVWVANIGDLVNSYDTSTKTREAIDQAFVQSQYLQR